MPPLFMYSMPEKSRMTAVAPSSMARAEGARQVVLAGRRDIAPDAQERGAADPVEADGRGGHAASPSMMSMKSERRVIRKISW